PRMARSIQRIRYPGSCPLLSTVDRLEHYPHLRSIYFHRSSGHHPALDLACAAAADSFPVLVYHHCLLLYLAYRCPNLPEAQVASFGSRSETAGPLRSLPDIQDRRLERRQDPGRRGKLPHRGMEEAQIPMGG